VHPGYSSPNLREISAGRWLMGVDFQIKESASRPRRSPLSQGQVPILMAMAAQVAAISRKG
jgi:hypothetical protein